MSIQGQTLHAGSCSLPIVYRLAEIAPPNIRREAKKKTQKHKQETDPRHTLYGHVQPRKRLRSRSSFMNAESLNPRAPKKFILEQWQEWDQSNKIESVKKTPENLPKDIDLTRKEWVTLNRARSKVGRTAKNKERWKLSKST